jgi:hypothetical protein
MGDIGTIQHLFLEEKTSLESKENCHLRVSSLNCPTKKGENGKQKPVFSASATKNNIRAFN